MLIKEAIRLQQLSVFIKKDHKESPVIFDSSNYLSHIEKVEELKGFKLRNNKTILFSSDPDVELVNSDGTTLAVIEIKGGRDTAGALERYGAAKKSFEDAQSYNPNVVTVFLANCITKSVESKILEDKTFSKYYDLSTFLTNDDNKMNFFNFVFNKLLKCPESGNI